MGPYLQEGKDIGQRVDLDLQYDKRRMRPKETSTYTQKEGIGSECLKEEKWWQEHSLFNKSVNDSIIFVHPNKVKRKTEAYEESKG